MGNRHSTAGDKPHPNVLTKLNDKLHNLEDKLHLPRLGSKKDSSDDPEAPHLDADSDSAQQVKSISASMRRRPSRFLVDPLEMTSSRVFRETPADTCPGCRGELTGAYEFINAAGKTWHPGCYKCGECGEVMKPSEDSMLNRGKVLHDACHAKLFGRVCVGCDEPILTNEEYVRALGKAFHKDHFTCFECNTSLAGLDPIHELDGYILCDKDYRIKSNIRCIICKEVILDGKYLFLGKRYFHPEHFKCFRCRTVIPEGENYVAHKGHAYCEKCIDIVEKESRKAGVQQKAPVAKEQAEQTQGSQGTQDTHATEPAEKTHGTEAAEKTHGTEAAEKTHGTEAAEKTQEAQ